MATTTVTTANNKHKPFVTNGVCVGCTCGSTVSHDSVGIRIETRCDDTQSRIHSRIDH